MTILKSIGTGSPEAISLAIQLRDQTGSFHQEAERSVGLPARIGTLGEYQSCLERFYRLYRPLEASLMRFSGWSTIGLDPHELAHSPRLASDLAALGGIPLQLEDVPESSLPTLPEFARALGALYVMEGSTLGSQIILRHLTGLLGAEIAGASAFFSGHGAQTGASWSRFRASLDSYGATCPRETGEVIEGAKITFQAIGKWMQI